MHSGNTTPRQFRILDPSRRVDITLGVAPEARFRMLIDHFGPELGELTRALRQTVPRPFRALLPPLAALLNRTACLPLADDWRAECAWLAGHAGVSPAEFALAQTQYTWVTWLRGLLPACALSVFWVTERNGFHLLRNLDWARGSLRAAFSRASLRQTYRWPGGPAAAETIGFPGMLGVLTGARLDHAQRPAFTVVLHQAPWSAWPLGCGEEPTRLLRRVLEAPSLQRFDQALAWLRTRKTQAACLVALIGRQCHELCVLEYPPGGLPAVRWAHGGRLCLTNHFDPAGPLAERNLWPRPDDDQHPDLLRNSRGRAQRLAELLAYDASAALRLHQTAPIANAQTVHIVDWALWASTEAEPPLIHCPLATEPLGT